MSRLMIFAGVFLFLAGPTHLPADAQEASAAENAAVENAAEPGPAIVKGNDSVARFDSNHATIDGTGPGWVSLAEDDFVRVNGNDKTLLWQGLTAIGSGQPIGVTRSVKSYKNFELVIEWQHQQSGGNSGVFAWVPESALKNLPPGDLPNGGIEIQMLDHGYTDLYLSRTKNKKKPFFFSTNGDIFAVGKSTMDPFAPLSPNGSRSFPSEDRTNGFGSWNHYYVRAINAEVRLWVNGVEVSGGKNCNPSEGYLCLESEGAPILFRNLRIRELP